MAGTADIALIGLAVMGENFILNMNDHGFVVCAFNRTVSKVHDFLNNEAKGTQVVGADSIADMISKLKSPKKIMLLVKAGQPVDDFIDLLLPHLQSGDIIIDGGNSEYKDTTRRVKALKERGILFVGSGISGGEEGARHGPSLMPGGSRDAWPHIKPIFQACSAKFNGDPCCDWVGDEGAGHFVKMVHNGIEYGDMQLISEAYHLMRVGLSMDNQEMADVFAKWNTRELESFLIEITENILRFKDEHGGYLLDVIDDAAGQKGTGKWTGITALDKGVPLTLITEAVFARCLSSLQHERKAASGIFQSTPLLIESKAKFIDDLEQALYASKIISYAQGFMLMRMAAQEYDWTLHYGAIAIMWRAGCIIRSRFLGDIKAAFDQNSDLHCLLVDDFFAKALKKAEPSWRRIVAAAVTSGVPVPCFSSALSFFDGYRTERLPSNLIQAQRDYFGAHTYKLIGKDGVPYHTNWTGHGGAVASTAYNV